jgi:hypothetical protein
MVLGGMEEVSTVELLELILASEQFIDAQIEFWLTVTFATIVASFAGDKHLTTSNRIIISVLYLLATVLFMSRWYYEFTDLEIYFGLLGQRGVFPEEPLITIVSRVILVVVGTVATLYFVNTRSGQDRV